MMNKLWKIVAAIWVFNFVFCLALFSAFTSSQQQVPTVVQLDSPINVSDSLPISLQKTAVKSRESAVGLVTFNVTTGEVAFASGTYIEYRGSLFILTAAHAVQSGNMIMAVTQEDQYPCGSIVYHSSESDIAIIEASVIPMRKPINIEKATPSYSRWKRSLETLDPVVYTGYPNATGPMTIQGKIMGFTDGVVFVNMYAWSGASGSGVFDEHGNIIGIVSALELGDFGQFTVPLDNSIIVRPTYLVDWAEAFKDY